MAGGSILLLAASLVFAPDAEIRGETVRLGDVADVSVLPEALRGKAADLPLARFDRDEARSSVSIWFLAAQARARLPLLASWLPLEQRGLVTLHRAAPVGTPLVRASGPQGIARGEAVSVNVRIGAFRVAREGRALAAARPGERLFVRTADRQVIAALCVDDR